MVKVEAIAVAYLNLKIPYGDARALVAAWNERFPQYNYQMLTQWILAGDVSYAYGKLTLARYTEPKDLAQLVVQMRSAGGVGIKDRRYNLKIYPKCLVGSEAVQWFMVNFDLTLDDAIRVGQRMLERDIIHHVVDEQDFKNDYLFYRFYEDE
ncbi:hypothetical protein IQ260_30610 [Leptolyngbya cf. ectocarpi LEGE 11479]|uniref:DEP domain-containing protein n=1 Tax=Leptolyngbya cf. ectocarpi LEGE 11479 TaxID=1828722 RepID=A0A929A0X9_LEPEC|nr:DEP domain-containing protein [Leptolyngbya ectocarpi]MBE9070993.1 hypothetical protein [Leptolyngbya cf. ectocarpi LEGE 11479]